MADNVELNPGTGGEVLATDEIGGVQHQRVKVGWGADGEYRDVDRVAGQRLPVEIFKSNDPIFQFADEVGDGSGNIEAVGDYSSAVRDFAIAPPAGRAIVLARLICTVKDQGSFDSGAYGNGITLTNGIQVEKRTGAVNGSSSLVQRLTGVVPIFTNTDWGSYCYDVSVQNFGSGDEVMLVRWTFARSGVNVVLDGDANEFLSIRLNDDFSNLNGHRFQLQGYDEALTP